MNSLDSLYFVYTCNIRISLIMNQDIILFLQKLLIVVVAIVLFLFFESFGTLFAPVVIAFILSLFFVPLLDKLNKYRIGD